MNNFYGDHPLTVFTPEGLFGVLRRGDHRLVRYRAGLVVMVLEGLDRLPHELAPPRSTKAPARTADLAKIPQQPLRNVAIRSIPAVSSSGPTT